MIWELQQQDAGVMKVKIVQNELNSSQQFSRNRSHVAGKNS